MCAQGGGRPAGPGGDFRAGHCGGGVAVARDGRSKAAGTKRGNDGPHFWGPAATARWLGPLRINVQRHLAAPGDPRLKHERCQSLPDRHIGVLLHGGRHVFLIPDL